MMAAGIMAQEIYAELGGTIFHLQVAGRPSHALLKRNMPWASFNTCIYTGEKLVAHFAALDCYSTKWWCWQHFLRICQISWKHTDKRLRKTYVFFIPSKIFYYKSSLDNNIHPNKHTGLKSKNISRAPERITTEGDLHHKKYVLQELYPEHKIYLYSIHTNLAIWWSCQLQKFPRMWMDTLAPVKEQRRLWVISLRQLEVAPIPQVISKLCWVPSSEWRSVINND